jgi:hypothetical protein
MNVRNNREYDAISKEIELQTLEMELADKKSNEANVKISRKNEEIDGVRSVMDDRKKDLQNKKNELDQLTKESQNEEDELIRRTRPGFHPHRRPAAQVLQQDPEQRHQRAGRGDGTARRLRRLLQLHPAPTAGRNPGKEENHRVRTLRPHPRRR